MLQNQLQQWQLLVNTSGRSKAHLVLLHCLLLYLCLCISPSPSFPVCPHNLPPSPCPGQWNKLSRDGTTLSLCSHTSSLQKVPVVRGETSSMPGLALLAEWPGVCVCVSMCLCVHVCDIVNPLYYGSILCPSHCTISWDNNEPQTVILSPSSPLPGFVTK